jgi:hypothetical protein
VRKRQGVAILLRKQPAHLQALLLVESDVIADFCHLEHRVPILQRCPGKPSRRLRLLKHPGTFKRRTAIPHDAEFADLGSVTHARAYVAHADVERIGGWTIGGYMKQRLQLTDL